MTEKLEALPVFDGLWAEIFTRHLPLDLSLHAAEDEGRTEDPTEHKKRKAREEQGRVFLTQELPQSLVLLSTFAVITVLSWFYYRTFSEMLVKYISNPQLIEFNAMNINKIISDCMIFFLKLFLPVGAAALVFAVLSSGVQTGFHFSAKPLRFDLKRIAFSMENLLKKTIFSKSQIINLFKILIKIAIIFIIAVIFIRINFEKILSFFYLSNRLAFAEMCVIIVKLVFTIGVIFALLSFPDYFLQRREYMEQLKMTKQEVKEEHRELEGSPEVRQRLRKRMYEIAYNKMLKEVPRADVVITNPTHLAIAVKYDQYEMDAPRVVAKGKDHMAEKIRKIARENDIVITENKPLAWELINVPIGDFIPDKLFGAVADVLAFVYRMKGRAA